MKANAHIFMPMTTHRRFRIGTRAAAAVLGLSGLAVLLGRVTVEAAHDLASATPRPESLLVVVLGAGALLALAWAAIAVAGLAHELLRHPLGARGGSLPVPAAARQFIVGMLLGAGALAPGVAAAAPAQPVGVVVQADEPAPVDLTYLGIPTPLDDRPTASPSAATTSATSTPGAPTTGVDRVLVERGDTLWGIAERLLAERPGLGDADVARAVHRLYAANAAAIGPDPDLIRPGTRLTVPAGLASGHRLTEENR